jgi:signal transduction histidine kinase
VSLRRFAPAESRPPAPVPAARVLVVDDERSVADVCREFLTGEGYTVTLAHRADEAVRRMVEDGCDLILTDINLPGMSGLELVREARRIDDEVPVVVMTGYASTANAIEALRQGAYDYVTKPFDLEEIGQIVERGVANRRLRAVNRELMSQLREKNDELREHESQLRDRVALATWQMTRLYEVGKEVSAVLDLAPRLSVIARRAAELGSAPVSVVYLREAETEDCRIAAAHGVDPSAIDLSPVHYFVAERSLGLAEGASAPVRRLDPERPIGLPNVADDAFDGVLAVPLVAEGQPIGVLAVAGKPGGFDEDDEGFFALLASQVAIAVHNSQLFEHTKSLDRLKSEFVAVVSHEIRTPLTSVKGAVELLSDDRFFANDDQQQKLLTIAHANAERLLVLINDILDFSKLESASLPMVVERQRLEPVIQQAAGNLRTLIEERRISFATRLPEDLPDLYLDSNRIAQVLTNLLSNAIKFSPQGGSIEVDAETAGDVVRVGVHDHGDGIAAQDVPKLFRKFSQLDSGPTRKVGGTGLGLVICKGIVEQHGGKIWVESTPGLGSSFYFTLPLAASAAAADATT